jgi:putative toxin-antitoxin system antitoxin component (TIGR02293 family)
MDTLETKDKREASRSARAASVGRTVGAKRTSIESIAQKKVNLTIGSKQAARVITKRSASAFFIDIYRMDPLDRISFIQTGVKADSFTKMARSMRRSKESVAKMLGLGASTLERKVANRERLSADQSERLVATAKLIGQVQAMVEESGDPAGFDAAQWFATWLEKPLSALGGRKAADLMNTAEGRELVSRLLATAQSGAYV